jgi:hypothetical protein
MQSTISKHDVSPAIGALSDIGPHLCPTLLMRTGREEPPQNFVTISKQL